MTNIVFNEDEAKEILSAIGCTQSEGLMGEEQGEIAIRIMDLYPTLESEYLRKDIVRARVWWKAKREREANAIDRSERTPDPDII